MSEIQYPPLFPIRLHPDDLTFRISDAAMVIRLLVLPTLAMFIAGQLFGAWPWVHWPALAFGSLLGLAIVTRVLFLAAVFVGIVRPRRGPADGPADDVADDVADAGSGGVDVPPEEVA